MNTSPSHPAGHRLEVGIPADMREWALGLATRDWWGEKLRQADSLEDACDLARQLIWGAKWGVAWPNKGVIDAVKGGIKVGFIDDAGHHWYPGIISWKEIAVRARSQTEQLRLL